MQIRHDITFVTFIPEMNKLHDLLLPFILRRVKSQVMKDLPNKTELILFHGMTALQKKYYRAMLMKDTSELLVF